jgi:hypothetical protein
MNGWIKLAALLAVAAIVAGLSGGAGATSSPAGATSAGSKAVTRATANTTAARRASLLRHANLQTVAGVQRYLRAIGVDPTGVVVQRGVRNYAGPSCPGAGWACTSTARPVVQIARGGGNNTFVCTSGSCAVVQTTGGVRGSRARSLTAAAAADNVAKCIKTIGLSQSCTISQSSSSANNVAIVVQAANKTSGLTQAASYSAQIMQRATGASNSNTTCLFQNVNIDGSTVAKRGTPVSVTLNAHQSASITQDAHGSNVPNGGNNTVEKAFTTGSCDASNPLSQTQTLTSTATGSGSITQNQNAADTGPNLSLDIEQNQSAGFLNDAGTSGANTAPFTQTSTLTSIAATPAGPVTQTQSSPSGGILAKVNQFSHGLSTANATQTETQCEDAEVPGGPLTCPDTPEGTPSYSLTQTQFGPIGTVGARSHKATRSLAKVGKGACPPDCSTQADNPNDTFTINQSSTQKNDTGQNQSNNVQAECVTAGNCIVDQAVTQQDTTTTNHQAGASVDTTVNCPSGDSCTTSTSTKFRSGDVFVSFSDGKVREYAPDGTLVRTLDTGSPFFVTGGAFASDGTFYVTEFGSEAVAKFAPSGALLGTFGSGYNLSPESIVFDTSGNAYVGQADGTKQVLKFDSAGNSLGSFAPTPEDRGTDWIDLAADQCTLYYTSEGTSIKRFDVCTNTQLADFATNLTGATAFALRLLPDGTVLVADSNFILHLNTAGQVVQTYSAPGGGFWFGVSLDPNGTSFWAENTGTSQVVKFNIATAAVEASFNTGTAAGTLGGVTVAP